MGEKLTYANVVSTIALFVVLAGGSAWAAGKITSKDIARDAVRSKQVKDSSLKAGDFKSGQLPQGARGPEGVQGAPGLPGLQGIQGAAGATNVVMRQGPDRTIPGNSFNSAEVSCQPGERATGGGVYNEDNVLVLRVTSSYPLPNPTTRPATGDGETPTGWRVWMGNQTATPYVVNAYVVCAAP